MKYKFLSLLLLAFCFKGTAMAGIDQKVYKTFQVNFPDAAQVSWIELSDGCEVSFDMKGSHYRIWYNPDATATKVLQYSEQNNLPVFINLQLKNKYGDKKIYGVEESMSEDDIQYKIILEDKDHWYTVKSDAYGHLSLESKLTKAP
jgi:hypothetical protein